MSDGRGTAVSARTRIPRRVRLLAEKENVDPTERGPSKTCSKENSARQCRRRFSGAFENEKRPGGTCGGLGTSSILKKAPFRVHCDAEVSVAAFERKLRPAIVRSIVASTVAAIEEPKTQRPSQIPRWRWGRTRSSDRLRLPERDNDRYLVRPEVGKRSRSASTERGRSIRRRSGSLVVEMTVSAMPVAGGHRGGTKPTRGNALDGGSAADESEERRDRLADGEGQGEGQEEEEEGGARRRRVEDVQVAPTRFCPTGTIGRAALSTRRGGRTAGCIATPLDGPPPIVPVAVKANRESKARMRRDELSRRVRPVAFGLLENRERRRKDNCKLSAEEPFSTDMLRHSEYSRDLPVVEREREYLGPRLSGNFLRGRFNAEQRRLVVSFLIHLSSQTRYPSFAIYQAVKLFDVAMDRAPASTFYVQLTALAALWIVLKMHQVREKVPSATTVVSLASDLYAGREDLLLEYERRVLRAVDFNLTFPDAFSLYAYHLIECSRYAKIPDGSMTFLHHCGGYLIDLTLLDENLCGISGCLVAIVAAELALGMVLDEGPAAWSTSGQPRWKFSRMLIRAASPRSQRFRSEEISELRGAMLRRIRSSAETRSGFESVYKKYSRTKHGRISETLVCMAKRISETSAFDS